MGKIKSNRSLSDHRATNPYSNPKSPLQNATKTISKLMKPKKPNIPPKNGFGTFQKELRESRIRDNKWGRTNPWEITKIKDDARELWSSMGPKTKERFENLNKNEMIKYKEELEQFKEQREKYKQSKRSKVEKKVIDPVNGEYPGHSAAGYLYSNGLVNTSGTTIGTSGQISNQGQHLQINVSGLLQELETMFSKNLVLQDTGEIEGVEGISRKLSNL